jgi:hypothetical protein
MAHSLLFTLSFEGLTLLAPIFEGSLEGPSLLQSQPRPKPLPLLHPKIVIPTEAARLFLRAAFWCVGPRSGGIAAHLSVLRSSSWPPSVNSVFLSL